MANIFNYLIAPDDAADHKEDEAKEEGELQESKSEISETSEVSTVAYSEPDPAPADISYSWDVWGTGIPFQSDYPYNPSRHDDDTHITERVDNPGEVVGAHRTTQRLTEEQKTSDEFTTWGNQGPERGDVTYANVMRDSQIEIGIPQVPSINQERYVSFAQYDFRVHQDTPKEMDSHEKRAKAEGMEDLVEFDQKEDEKPDPDNPPARPAPIRSARYELEPRRVATDLRDDDERLPDHIRRLQRKRGTSSQNTEDFWGVDRNLKKMR